MKSKLGTSSWPTRSRAIILVALGLILVLVVILVVRHANDRGKPTVATPTPTTGGASENIQKGESIKNTSPSSGSTNSTEPGDSKSSAGGTTTTTLITPSADSLVSSHHASLSGNNEPSALTSVCTTTPGASCTIQFIQNGVVHQLTPQTTDRGGSAYWNNWSLQDIGLTPGAWQVQAVATLGSQSQHASDALSLEVAP